MAFSMTDRARLKAKLEGECEAQGSYSNVATAVSAVHTVSFVYEKQVADAMANSASTIWALYVARACKVTAAYLMPSGALTADNTNYAIVAAKYDDGAGGADTTIATWQTTIAAGTGNWVAGTKLTATLTTPVEIAAGQTILIDISKLGGGVAVPICAVQLELEYI